MTGTAARDRVLVIDGNPGIRALLTSALGLAGYHVEVTADLPRALEKICSFRPEVIVLDVTRPGRAGLGPLARLRSHTIGVPVLFLTTPDHVRYLQQPGDDCLTEPFSIAGIIARITALRRRTHSTTEPAGSALTFHDLSVDVRRHEVHRANRLVSLSPTEFKLLHILITHPGQVLSQGQILEAVWQYDFGNNTAAVQRFITSLRHKIDHGHTPLIHTIHGTGYTLRHEHTRTAPAARGSSL